MYFNLRIVAIIKCFDQSLCTIGMQLTYNQGLGVGVSGVGPI